MLMPRGRSCGPLVHGGLPRVRDCGRPEMELDRFLWSVLKLTFFVPPIHRLGSSRGWTCAVAAAHASGKLRVGRWFESVCTWTPRYQNRMRKVQFNHVSILAGCFIFYQIPIGAPCSWAQVKTTLWLMRWRPKMWPKLGKPSGWAL